MVLLKAIVENIRHLYRITLEEYLYVDVFILKLLLFFLLIQKASLEMPLPHTHFLFNEIIIKFIPPSP